VDAPPSRALGEDAVPERRGCRGPQGCGGGAVGGGAGGGREAEVPVA
jgi:hypothetical protein